MTSTLPEIYENRVTLFLDILGFRSLIADKRETQLLEVLRIPHTLRAKYPFDGTTSMRMTAFSDSIVVSEQLDPLGHAYVRLIHYANYLSWMFMARGILVRGGIAVGELHHEQDIVFGAAMVEAYEIESQLATYPRIAVSTAVRAGLIAHVDSQLSDNIVMNGVEKSILRQDFDGVWHVDFLNPASAHPPELYPEHFGSDHGERAAVTGQQILARMGQKIEGILKAQPVRDKKTATKYAWLASYYENRRRSPLTITLKAG